MAQEPTHPLLSLPDDEIVEKIREMNFGDIIEFSLTSEKTKNLIKSAKLQGTNVKVAVVFEFVVGFEFKHRERERNFWKFNPDSSEVKITSNNGPKAIRKTIRRDQFGLEDWLEHFETIFNFRVTDFIIFEGSSDEYNPADVKKYFGVPTELTIDKTESYAHNQAILQTFLPVESLSINSNVLENYSKPKILIQNFKTLRIDKFLPDQPGVVTLNDLLMTNSKSIDIRSARMGPKDINKFIKLWQHGANPQMVHLNIKCDFEEKEYQETVLKGINYTVLPYNERRSFWLDSKSERHVRYGDNIWRKDGVKATIQVEQDGCEMFVWFDHCFG
ncbi:hypothetical protein CAEBREN_14040 [Caenorhabditis brenneri]|uniref:Sdz-33 F-box domain-containing protein n=1 Tax=Caenorhabditis brenneri TaxID=135651 RepID=G0N0I3_CAEBE|nr:hypothetical protein CAEBREN_14040 [Caenorhabditis brenneri]